MQPHFALIDNAICVTVVKDNQKYEKILTASALRDIPSGLNNPEDLENRRKELEHLRWFEILAKSDKVVFVAFVMGNILLELLPTMNNLSVSEITQRITNNTDAIKALKLAVNSDLLAKLTPDFWQAYFKTYNVPYFPEKMKTKSMIDEFIIRNVLSAYDYLSNTEHQCVSCDQLACKGSTSCLMCKGELNRDTCETLFHNIEKNKIIDYLTDLPNDTQLLGYMFYTDLAVSDKRKVINYVKESKQSWTVILNAASLTFAHHHKRKFVIQLSEDELYCAMVQLFIC